MSTLLIDEKPDLNTLVHHGVKGMKWGVTRTREQLDADGNISKRAAKKAEKHARGGGRSTESVLDRKKSASMLREYMWDSIKHDPVFARMTKEDYDSLSTRGETFVKNTTLKRISTSPDKVVKGATFVSKHSADSNFYKAVLPAVGPNAKGYGGGRKQYKQDNYEIVLKTTKKLKAPSEKERVDAFMELLKEPSIKVPGKKAPISGRKYLENQGYKAIFKQPSDRDFAFKTWNAFVQGQGDKDNPLSKAYFDKLSLKGYNILLDDNDAGRYTKKPLIIIDPSSVKVTDVKKLSTDEINQAQRKLGKRDEQQLGKRVGG